MNITAIGAALGILAVGAVVGVASYISAASSGNRQEQTIQAQYQQNQNRYSSFTSAAVEQMAVAGQFKQDLQEVIQSALQGRYGAARSASTAIAVIQERYPGELSPQLYQQVQRTIESGRRDFANDQKILIDRVRAYRVDLGSPWKGSFLRAAGYPSTDFDFAQYAPVLNNATSETFRTQVDQGIQWK